MSNIGLDAQEKLQNFKKMFNDDKNHERVNTYQLSSETGEHCN